MCLGGGQHLGGLAADRGEAEPSEAGFDVGGERWWCAAHARFSRDFVRENPDRAALVVRDLLRDDKAEGADRNG